MFIIFAFVSINTKISEMDGMWNNPLGLHGISVGDLALQIGIDYVLFAATGLPSSFGFRGTLSVQEFQAKVFYIRTIL